MDFNEYALAVMVQTTLDEARAQAARRRLAARRRRTLRARLGGVLVALGRRLLEADGAPAPAVEVGHA